MRQFLYFAFKIKDGLFIGDINAPSEREFLLSNKISSIVNCASSQVRPANINIGLKFLNFDWIDADDQVILDDEDKNINQVYEFMNQAVENCESVLVCSLRGQSRALTVITAFLMRKYKWSLYKTLEYMNSKRADFEIRATFLRQLLSFEQREFGTGAIQSCSKNWKGSDDENNDADCMLMRNTYLNAQQINTEDTANSQSSREPSKRSKRLKWAAELEQEIDDTVHSTYNPTLIPKKFVLKKDLLLEQAKKANFVTATVPQSGAHAEEGDEEGQLDYEERAQQVKLQRPDFESLLKGNRAHKLEEDEEEEQDKHADQQKQLEEEEEEIEDDDEDSVRMQVQQQQRAVQQQDRDIEQLQQQQQQQQQQKQQEQQQQQLMKKMAMPQQNSIHQQQQQQQMQQNLVMSANNQIQFAQRPGHTQSQQNARKTSALAGGRLITPTRHLRKNSTPVPQANNTQALTVGGIAARHAYSVHSSNGNGLATKKLFSTPQCQSPPNEVITEDGVAEDQNTRNTGVQQSATQQFQININFNINSVTEPVDKNVVVSRDVSPPRIVSMRSRQHQLRADPIIARHMVQKYLRSGTEVIGNGNNNTNPYSFLPQLKEPFLPNAQGQVQAQMQVQAQQQSVHPYSTAASKVSSSKITTPPPQRTYRISNTENSSPIDLVRRVHNNNYIPNSQLENYLNEDIQATTASATTTGKSAITQNNLMVMAAAGQAMPFSSGISANNSFTAPSQLYNAAGKRLLSSARRREMTPAAQRSGSSGGGSQQTPLPNEVSKSALDGNKTDLSFFKVNNKKHFIAFDKRRISTDFDHKSGALTMYKVNAPVVTSGSSTARRALSNIPKQRNEIQLVSSQKTVKRRTQINRFMVV